MNTQIFWRYPVRSSACLLLSWQIPRFSSISTGEYLNNTSKQTMTASSHNFISSQLLITFQSRSSLSECITFADEWFIPWRLAASIHIKNSDVSGIVFVDISDDVNTVPETSVIYSVSTRLIAREDLIAFSRRKDKAVHKIASLHSKKIWRFRYCLYWHQWWCKHSARNVGYLLRIDKADHPRRPHRIWSP
jgi:hypothetical protein